MTLTALAEEIHPKPQGLDDDSFITSLSIKNELNHFCEIIGQETF